MDKEATADTKGRCGSIRPTASAGVADDKHRVNPGGEGEHGHANNAGNKCVCIHSCVWSLSCLPPDFLS